MRCDAFFINNCIALFEEELFCKINDYAVNGMWPKFLKGRQSRSFRSVIKQVVDE